MLAPKLNSKFNMLDVLATWLAEILRNFRMWNFRKNCPLSFKVLKHIYIARGYGHSEDFRNIFQPNIGKDQKKLHHLSAGLLIGTVPYYGKSSPSYCITFIRRLDEGLR